MDMPEPRFDDPERVVRLHVHVALASVFLAFLAPVVSWALFLRDRNAPAIRWKRRLLALAVLDTVLVCGLALSAALGFDVHRTTTETPKIGVVLESHAARGEAPGEHEPKGAVVERVLPNSPAAAAEIEPGDRIVAVDGKPIQESEELIEVVGKTEEGSKRRLEILRDGRPIEVTVTPTTGPMVRPRARRSLFEPVDVEPELERTTSRRYALGAGVIEVGLLGALAIAGRRRRASAAPGIAVLVGLVALTLVSSVVMVAFKLTIGSSLGALLVTLLSGSMALLVVGLMAAAILRPREPVQIGPKIETPKAIALGIFYGVTGATRVGAFVAILVAAFGLQMRTASESFGLDLSWGWLGIGLFVLASVIVAPIAEEVLFRGVLLPWLTRWMRPGPAVAWTTAIFALGHIYYGVGALLIAYYGLVLGWARLRTGKLGASIALHALLNGTTVATLLAARSE